MMRTKSSLFLLLGLCLPLVPARAATDIGFKGIGPRFGLIARSIFGDVPIEFGVNCELGTLAKQLHWDATATYWNVGRYYRYSSSDFGLNTGDIALHSGVNYHFFKGVVEPYAGGGLGLHFRSWDYATYDFQPFSKSDAKVNLYINSGIQFKFGEKIFEDLIVRAEVSDPQQLTFILQMTLSLGK